MYTYGKHQQRQSQNSHIHTSFEGTKITIPSPTNWLTLIFGTLWLIVWCVMFIVTLQTDILFSNTSGVDWFSIIWVVSWILMGSFAIVLVFWGYFGNETLLIKENRLHFNKTIFNIGIKRVLSVRKINRIRFNEIKIKWGDKGSTWHYWGVGEGKIKLTYGKKIHSFGLELDDAEANYLVSLLKKEIEP
ncbi:MAG: hypothetical protein ACPGVB_03205 [Chitinophagales bacterium]